jgi:hypothetical protein
MMRTVPRVRGGASFAFVLGFACFGVDESRAEEPSAEGVAGVASRDEGPSVASLLTRRADDGRLLDPEPEEDLLRLIGHGEWQVRGVALGDLDLDRTPSYAFANPGAASQPLGQRAYGTQWLRLRPTLQVGKRFRIVAQADVFAGLAVGDLTRDVGSDHTPRSTFDSIGHTELRWLYAEWLTPVGLLRAGRQPSHWGLGMVANDGDHRRLFGDYRRGSIGDRIGFATKPFGVESPFVVALAGDLVRRDNFADEGRGDEVMQGVAALLWQGRAFEAGVYGAMRQQRNARVSVPNVATYTDRLDATVGDAYVRAAANVAPGVDGFLGAEVALSMATSDFPRTAQQLRDGERTSIRGLGVLAEVGLAGGRLEQPGFRARARWVATLEYGFASGQADPFARDQTRFTFDPNHRVGLVLFDEVIRWQTARAATAIQDPYLVAQSRPIPGIDLLPTNGAVNGATYLNPTVVYRPDASLEVALGVVVAQASSDVVDPYRVASEGALVNYRGGAARGRDYGVEFDAGFEKRWVSEAGLVPQLGFQAGLLLPGTALADAKGNTPPPPWVVQGRAGLQF